MAYPLLNVSPSQLEFLFEAERELKSVLNLRNVNDGVRVAFKIKTTNSERFVVCPPAGIVEPGTTRLVKVYLKSHKDFDDELRLCKDRFLVQSVVVDHTLDEQEIISDIFRNGQRQEAKLKVVVAAPLALSSVLENEIRTIAVQQGVEGHRAVVRKFSELLLARGIISQAQVALAFSTVGEIFQSMQNAYKASTAERERCFQQFLGKGSGGVEAEVAALANPAESDSGMSSVPSLTFPRRPTADSITLRPSLSAGASPSHQSEPKSLHQEMSPPKAPETPAAEGMTDHVKKFNEEAIDTLFTGNGGLEEEKAEVLPPSAFENDQKAASRRTVRQLRFEEAESAESDTDLAFGSTETVPERVWRTGRQNPKRRTIRELIDPEQPGDATPDIADVITDKIHEQEQDKSSPGRIALLTQVDTEMEPEAKDGSSATAAATAKPAETHRSDDELVVEKEKARPKGVNTAREKASLRPSVISEIEPEPEIVPDELDRLIVLSETTGRGRPATREEPKDTLGRLNPVTSIDRLATPATRKPALPAASKRIDSLLNGNGVTPNGGGLTRADDGQNVKNVFKPWRPSEDRQAAEALEQAPSLEAQASLHSEGSTGSGNLGVPIPSGNTKKMAHLFGGKPKS